MTHAPAWLSPTFDKLRREEWADFDRLPQKVRERLAADCCCSASALTRKVSEQYQNPSDDDYLNCIAEMIAREQWRRDYQLRRAKAQARADAIGKAVLCNYRWIEPRPKLERRL